MSKIIQIMHDGVLPTKFNINVNRYLIRYSLPHWHEFYEIEICLSGHGVANINGTDYNISPGTIQFITPSDFHSYNMTEDTMSITNFTFNSSCIESSQFRDILSSMKYMVCHVDEEQIKRFVSLIDIIEKELNNDNTFNKQYASYILTCILIDIFRIHKSNNSDVSFSNQTDSHIHKILYYIRTHFKEPLSLKDVAEHTNLSAGYISKIFKENVGCGFKQFLIELRLLHAENFLINSDESISDISYFCGFTSISHFTNAFKKKYKISPRSFRKKNTLMQNTDITKL